jgi:hypothetical protein
MEKKNEQLQEQEIAAAAQVQGNNQVNNNAG